MKKILTIFVTFLILLTHVSPVLALKAISRDQAVLNASVSAKRQERIEERTDNKVTRLNDKATLEIDRRVASLKKLIERLSEIKKLNPSQKASMTSQIQTEISSLQALGIKIKADSDPALLKTDVQSIIKSYKVYRLFIPKIQVIAAADRLDNVAAQMSSISAKLQEKIDIAKTAGKDVAAIQKLLDDMKSKIADAKIQATNAINAVISLTPEEDPGKSSAFKSARKMIQVGHQDLVDAHLDLKMIIHDLREADKSSGSESTNEDKSVKPKIFKDHPFKK